jgi:hypothetical protein
MLGERKGGRNYYFSLQVSKVSEMGRWVLRGQLKNKNKNKKKKRRGQLRCI